MTALTKRESLFYRHAEPDEHGDLRVPCSYCRASLLISEMTADHAHPKSRGGRYLLPACKPCNGTKGDLTERKFRWWLTTSVGLSWLRLGPARRVFNLRDLLRTAEAREAKSERQRLAAKARERPTNQYGPIPDWPRGGRDDYEGEDR